MGRKTSLQSLSENLFTLKIYTVIFTGCPEREHAYGNNASRNDQFVTLFVLFPQKTYPQMDTLSGHTAPHHGKNDTQTLIATELHGKIF